MGFKVVEQTFSLLSWKHYLRSMQKYLQSAQKRLANTVKTVSKLANTRITRILATVPSIDHKITSKVLKKNGDCCKTGLEADEHTLTPVSWQRYLRSTQKLQCVKKRTANPAKSISMLANTPFGPYLCNSTSDRCKIPPKC